jgi:hypothetical protein
MAATVAKAVLWGAAVALALVAVAAGLDMLTELPRSLRTAVRPSAWVAWIVVAAALLWRGRRTRSLASIALWVEERAPSLQYALVTSLEPQAAPVAPMLGEQVARTAWERELLPRAVARAALPPLVALGLAVAMLLMLPQGVVARVRAPRPGDSLDRPSGAGVTEASRLSPLLARVVPPVYTSLAAIELDDPHTVSALAGSRVAIEGRGLGEGISAELGAARFTATTHGPRWRVVMTMPSSPAALQLRDREFDRLIVLDAQADSAPVVTLVAPARDTILRAPTGRIRVHGDVRDGLGLASTWLEYIISSGQGESFRFRSGVLSRRTLDGARQADISLMLSIDSLRLSPGDVVHMRLVARDRNPARDAGTGTSETRVIRIARRGEYDSVAVEGAPPPVTDTSALSQRMLIMLTEALVKRQPRLPRDTVVAESRAIGVDQSRLRRRVGEIIFSRLTGEEGAEHAHEEVEERGEMTAEELLRAAEEATEHGAGEVLDFAEGESPVVAINRPLLEAYNAMWAASSELNVGAPRRALPHMYAALAAIERAREAERVYLRGRPGAVVVDVNRVRLAGQRDTLPPARRAAASDDTASAPPVRFARAATLIDSDRSAAIDSLLLLRVELLGDQPSAAAALGDAVAALRAGIDATPALARTRAALAGSPSRGRAMRAWGLP